ncbi:hypothetical protein LJB77_03265, partial [Ruminococcaceae bacterium OttesenSCG-928-N02]|nr:hypothetical protein [Ruminococcaceae bacterium OttesenSCG-928-N02]
GAVLAGEMLTPIEDYNRLAQAQRNSEVAALVTLGLITGKSPLEAAQMLQGEIATAAQGLPDAVALSCVAIFPRWQNGVPYIVGDRVRDGATLYKCLQEHVSQEDWAPNVTPAIWVAVADPGEEWPLIPNPITAENPYMQGQKGRTEDGRKWTSRIDNNVWQPSEYPAGWQRAEE